MAKKSADQGVGIAPLTDRIVIRQSDVKEEIRGGIILPDTAQEKPQEGEVIAGGPGRIADDGTRIAPTVKKGDLVLYSKYAGTEYKAGEDELLIIRESDVLATIG